MKWAATHTTWTSWATTRASWTESYGFVAGQRWRPRSRHRADEEARITSYRARETTAALPVVMAMVMVMTVRTVVPLLRDVSAHTAIRI